MKKMKIQEMIEAMKSTPMSSLGIRGLSKEHNKMSVYEHMMYINEEEKDEDEVEE